MIFTHLHEPPLHIIYTKSLFYENISFLQLLTVKFSEHSVGAFTEDGPWPNDQTYLYVAGAYIYPRYDCYNNMFRLTVSIWMPGRLFVFNLFILSPFVYAWFLFSWCCCSCCFVLFAQHQLCYRYTCDLHSLPHPPELNLV